MKTLVPVILALAVFPATADARSRITQTQADQEAASEVADDRERGEELAGPDAPYYITDVEVDPCEIVTSRRAECDVTFYFSNGDACDGVIDVRLSRRGRLSTETNIYVCDFD